MANKQCCKCKSTKELVYFSKNKSTKDGLAKQCKECINNNREYKDKALQRAKEYYESNKEKVKKYKDEYYLENKEELNKIGKEYYENNKEEISKKSKKYREINEDKIKESKAIYYENNKEKIKEYQNQYRPQNKEKIKKQQQEYRKANLEKLKKYSKTYFINNKEKIYNYLKNYLKCNNNAKIRRNLRSRVSGVIKSKGAKKSASTIELIGCSIEFFVEYIEQKFTTNMSWNNYGKYGWHLDHIKPCSSFNLQDEEEQKKCFHYTNYQPLWATTEIAIKNGEDSSYIGNLEKHAKFL